MILRGRYDDESREKAYNWLMMASSAVTDKTKQNKPKAEQETAQPTAARFNKKFIKLKTALV